MSRKRSTQAAQNKIIKYLVVVTNPSENTFRIFFSHEDQEEADKVKASLSDLLEENGSEVHVIPVPAEDGIVNHAPVRNKKTNPPKKKPFQPVALPISPKKEKPGIRPPAEARDADAPVFEERVFS
jgi:hypothetical protein